uniref:Uncharacterized protein n=1 Tax=Arundo donax TaxID=35708 RepID=A0A0A9ENH3_ARUDO
MTMPDGRQQEESKLSKSIQQQQQQDDDTISSHIIATRIYLVNSMAHALA